MLKNKWNFRYSLSVIMTLVTICALITPQVIAVVQFESDNEINDNLNQYQY